LDKESLVETNTDEKAASTTHAAWRFMVYVLVIPLLLLFLAEWLLR
jgi:hypothetical protein